MREIRVSRRDLCARWRDIKKKGGAKSAKRETERERERERDRKEKKGGQVNFCY
jgi:hypothetical protein